MSVKGTSTRPPRRQREDADATRSRILNAAEDLFVRKGYAGASVSQICAACDVSASSLYWHFGSKAGLVGAVLERGIDRYLARAEASAQDPQAPRYEVIADFFRAVTANPEILRLALIIGLVEPPDDEIGRAHARARAHGLGVMRQGVAHAFSLPPESETVSVWAQYALAVLDGAVIANHMDGAEIMPFLDLLVSALDVARTGSVTSPDTI